MKDITVLIPTSPIPSHPSTEIMDETVRNIRQYTDAKIVIMCDGVHESLEHRRDSYVAYIDKLRQKDYGDCKVIVFDEHLHQSMMTKFILENEVQTSLILFCEHDTSPIGEIPFDRICEMVSTSEIINYLRFNIFHEILEEHQYLMIDKEPTSIYGVRLVRTVQWSQRPHIAKTSWYREILEKFFVEKKGMIEDVMHSIVIESEKALGHDIFGLAIYTPEGNQLRSYHSDGRKSDEKIIEA